MIYEAVFKVKTYEEAITQTLISEQDVRVDKIIEVKQRRACTAWLTIRRKHRYQYQLNRGFDSTS